MEVLEVPPTSAVVDDDGQWGPTSPRSGLVILDEHLKAEYDCLMTEEDGIRLEALKADREMRDTPTDALDRPPRANIAAEPGGLVQRRAPLNPLASPMMGKWRFGHGQTKVSDPALQDNPLRGRLIVTMCSSCVLLWVFWQSLILNFTETGKYYVAYQINSMFGPSPEVLNQLGGLNTNKVREGESVRLYWSMWMHSGWLHILLNIVAQIQFLYMLEPDWGFFRTVLCFWISGISGNLLSSIIDPCSITVGSSGSLYGLMGAIIVYCIEYWKSIPRPACILIFTSIVVVISFLAGFTGNTDNWAHLGGLVGGVLFSFTTLTTLTACENCIGENCVCWKTDDNETGLVGADGRKKKKVLKRVKMAHINKGIKPTCKCGIREWSLRLGAGLLLFVDWFLCYWYLYKSYEFQPLGHITFKGATACCCCYTSADVPKVRANWYCAQCEAGYKGGTWQEFCDGVNNPASSSSSTAASRLLLDDASHGSHGSECEDCPSRQALRAASEGARAAAVDDKNNTSNTYSLFQSY
eukprot:Lankesteria_metandrocarpae@DN5216_c0_g3_i2.p1